MTAVLVFSNTGVTGHKLCLASSNTGKSLSNFLPVNFAIIVNISVQLHVLINKVLEPNFV